ncbi:MAG: lysophospholipase [Chloroflexi bacterium]|nr:MAG: lysophospholipase [Chloroflexota bacterium]TME40805.1 MAG: lysophospholipase [Chloroflexota bacterium]TME51011.1 MAG: lysophospholipase [Chloroflexota bacterium]
MASVTLAAEGALAAKGFINSADGTRLAYRSWPISGAKITFAVVHGLGEHSGRYERFADGMGRHGMATFAVDLRGHGESEGKRGHVDSWSQWVDDAAAFVSHVESQQSGEVVPLGHSFGGVVVLSAVRSSRLAKAKRFVLSSPALKLKAEVPAWKTSLGKVMASIAPRLALDNEVDPGTVSRVPEVVAAYRADPLVHSKISSRLYAEWQRAAAENLGLAGDVKIPFLILAGTGDRLIDFEGSTELHARAPETSELQLLEGRYHEPFNDLGSDEVFALIAEWLKK